MIMASSLLVLLNASGFDMQASLVLNVRLVTVIYFICIFLIVLLAEHSPEDLCFFVYASFN